MVIVVNDEGQRQLVPRRWGLIPSWVKDTAIGNRMMNARAETLTVKPAFRVAIRKRRCLIIWNCRHSLSCAACRANPADRICHRFWLQCWQKDFPNY